ncbi:MULTISPECIES: response regulator transcription factor [Paraburkholderia]|uniref:response regulator transcription factor n=1 Tax=Paraburkholderia TaxID=1822464 RepID=UPI0038B8980E
MVQRIYVGSTDDFMMSHAVDGPGPIAHPRVLVVDDYPACADALQLLLVHNGFEACSTGDACGAYSLAEQWQPFAIVIDIAMPGITGFELARRLKVSALTCNMLLVAFTARGSREDIARAFEAGFDAYCVKPLSPVRLLTLLQAVAGRSEP